MEHSLSFGAAFLREGSLMYALKYRFSSQICPIAEYVLQCAKKAHKPGIKKVTQRNLNKNSIENDTTQHGANSTCAICDFKSKNVAKSKAISQRTHQKNRNDLGATASISFKSDPLCRQAIKRAPHSHIGSIDSIARDDCIREELKMVVRKCKYD